MVVRNFKTLRFNMPLSCRDKSYSQFIVSVLVIRKQKPVPGSLDPHILQSHVILAGIRYRMIYMTGIA